MPLLGKVPLSEELREHADAGTPLVLEQPDAPAAQAIRAAARGIVAATPQALPLAARHRHRGSRSVRQRSPAVSGTELPMAQ